MIGIARRKWLMASLLGGISTVAAAQTPPPAPPEPTPAETAAPSGDSAEILVTAQRRTERLRDVPMSITALSQDTLLKSGITNTSDLARVTPGVTLPFYGSFLQPSIRGVTSTGANVGESPNVAMYIDGVYQPQQIATLIDLPDVQQIEILKGPQGALYGQNATGGAILVNSLAPSFTTSGMASASYGNYNAVQLRGYITGGLTDGIAASIAGGYQNRDGFRRHVVTGQRDRGLDSKVVRGKLLLEPAEGAKITLGGYYTNRIDSAMYAGVPYNNNSVSYALIPTAPRVTSPKQFAANPDVFTRIRSYGFNGHGEIETGIGTINSITAYFRNKVKYLADADYGPVNYAFASTSNLGGHYFTQELNLVSKRFGPVSVLAGVFYLNGADTFNTSDFTINAPNLPPAPRGAVVFQTRQYGRLKKEIIAGYAEATLNVTDKLILTGGGRYTSEKQRARSSPSLPAPIVDRPGGPVTFSQFSPRVTARYELTPEANVYASFSKGFKSGILNVTNLAQAPVNPEKITAYEAGFKGRLAPGFTFNLAAFWYDYKDLQVVAYVPPLYIQQNAASARIKGVEAEATLKLAPGLSLNGGISYLDARYRDFPAAQVFQPTGFGNVAVTRDLGGRRLLRAPKWSGNLTATYEVETGAGKLGAFVSGYYNSGFGLEPENRVRQGEYATVDAEISFQPAALKGVRLSVWGKNLSNKDYLASALVSQLADGVSYAEPRTFGVRAEYRF